MPGNPARRQRRVEGGSPKRINVRTTVETHAALVAASMLAGLSLPRYLIESALHGPLQGWSLRDQRWWVERLDVAETRLIRIGTNLNQMAAVANATGELNPALTHALTYLDATLDQLRTVLDALDPSDRSRQR
ncbi:MAG TPA: plasmid mobilization relaxosome protein MobC [Pseudonocardiaceae bacterium]|jgi:hypothetical protein|nr:plasmid mobilization relaxosome protein MobC [Pseudonocardiaceae bacterium]